MKGIEYHPLGSIVQLNGGIQKLIIISRGITVKNDGRLFFFDYGGVPYPEGVIGDQMVYFNHNSIARILFSGFKDEDDKIVVDNINKYLEMNPDVVYGNAQTWNQ